MTDNDMIYLINYICVLISGIKHKIETEVVQIDFSDGRPVYDKIMKHVEKKEIGMLSKYIFLLTFH